jgi:hypothetical protein
MILYQGASLVIYYEQNSWNFTRIGHIKDAAQEELKVLVQKLLSNIQYFLNAFVFGRIHLLKMN